MAWILEEYSKTHGYTPGIVTGKPLELGGSEGRLEATGHGVACVARQAAADCSLLLQNAQVVIQGLGNVGFHAARSLATMGARIIAISDVCGGVLCESGIDVAQAQRHVQDNGCLKGMADAATISNAELLELSCDILIPAAMESTIDCDNASSIKARLIVEAANIPVTHQADAILQDRNIPVVPDLLANAGGVLASYYEWVQNLQEFPWQRDTVLHRVEERLLQVYHEVRRLAVSSQVYMRTAAYELAIKRVASAVSLRGF